MDVRHYWQVQFILYCFPITERMAAGLWSALYGVPIVVSIAVKLEERLERVESSAVGDVAIQSTPDQLRAKAAPLLLSQRRTTLEY